MSKLGDKEILINFANEVKEYVPQIEFCIGAFLSNQAESNYLGEAIAHSENLKGAASLVGLTVLSGLAWYLEDALRALAKGIIPVDNESEGHISDLTSQIGSYLALEDLDGSEVAPIVEQGVSSYRRLMSLSKEGDRMEIEMFLGRGSYSATTDFESDSEASEPLQSLSAGDEEHAATDFEQTGRMQLPDTEDIPAELLEVFLMEAGDHLDNIATHLVDLDAAPQNKDSLQEVRRSVHTIKGTAGMVGFGTVSEIAHRMEDLLDELYEGTRPWTEETIKLLMDTSDVMTAMITEQQASVSRDFPLEELFDRYTSLMKDVPAALEIVQTGGDEPPPRVSSEIVQNEPLGVYSESSSPILIEIFLKQLEKDFTNLSFLIDELISKPADSRSLGALKEVFNSIRGLILMVGNTENSEICSTAELVISGLMEQEKSVSSGFMELLRQTYELLNEIFFGSIGMADVEIRRAELLQRFKGLVTVEEISIERALREREVDTPALKSPKTSEKKAKSVQTETLRVPMNRVDALIKLVSELMVSRSVFEQQLKMLTGELDELKPEAVRVQRISHLLQSALDKITPGGLNGDLNGEPGSVFGAKSKLEIVTSRQPDLDIVIGEFSELSNDLSVLEGGMRKVAGNFENFLTNIGTLTGDIQDGLLHMRMIPLSTLSNRLSRTVRVTSSKVGKNIKFDISGIDVELDKSVLEEMADPLIHILRNSVDHGIEKPGERVLKGKADEGHITVGAHYEGNQVVIKIEDDGKGLDTQKIRNKAISLGLISEPESEKLTDDTIHSFIFAPGFSTAQEVSEISGRGVGMDVVKSTVQKLKGTVSVDSVPGRGTKFFIRLPMMLAMTRVVLVKCFDQTFGIPLASVKQIVRVQPEEITSTENGLKLNIAGIDYSIHRLADVLEVDGLVENTSRLLHVMIVEIGDERLAFVVDKFLEAKEVFISTTGSHLKRVKGTMGATIMGDGKVVLILNPFDLVDFIKEMSLKGYLTAGLDSDPFKSKMGKEKPAFPIKRPLRVLIVDDSVSVRRVMTNLVESEGWKPFVAGDGRQALEIIQQSTEPPDIVLIDLEMPVMDGYEFASTLKVQEFYRNIPIVMITSRSSEDNKRRAFEAGVSEFMVKPFQEDELLGVVRRLTGNERSNR